MQLLTKTFEIALHILHNVYYLWFNFHSYVGLVQILHVMTSSWQTNYVTRNLVSEKFLSRTSASLFILKSLLKKYIYGDGKKRLCLLRGL